MGKNKKKQNRGMDKVQYPDTYYTKFKKIHIATNGIITICEATTVDGVTEYFGWDKKSNRELIRKNVLPDAEIIVEKNVIKGWDYE